MRVLGYSWVGIVTGDFEGTLRFFTEKLGLPLVRREDDAGFAHLRLPSGQLFEVFGPNSDSAHVHGDSCPVVGFEVEETGAGDSWVYFRGPDGQLYELQRQPKNLK